VFHYVKAGATQAEKEQAEAEGCPGIAGGIPLADPGNLCVYAGQQNNATFQTSFKITDTQTVTAGAGPSGTILVFACTSTCSIQGAWAVTAEE
jgi:hypothetical protein